jgi:hypothetical protein
MKDYSVEDFNRDFNIPFSLLRPVKVLNLKDVINIVKPDLESRPKLNTDMEIYYG